eukprot:m.969885 g.969885  ORF g.969885 m.969885 type:complete len:169 (-) comp23921_c0_seq16:4604-5110(-)
MPLHRSLYNIILTVDARLGVCCVSFPAGVPATAFFTAACVVSKLDALESARLLLWFVFCAGVTFPGEIGYSGIPELSCTEEPSCSAMCPSPWVDDSLQHTHHNVEVSRGIAWCISCTTITSVVTARGTRRHKHTLQGRSNPSTQWLTLNFSSVRATWTLTIACCAPLL